jgi:hypothetical protein
VARRYPLGVTKVTFGLATPVEIVASRAAALGFDHIDVGLNQLEGCDEAALAIPIGDRVGGFEPRLGCTIRAPHKGRAWDEAVAILRSVPGVRVEPSAMSVLNSTAAVRSMCAQVPGLRLTLDTGWVANWGGDPVELLDLADHVQLRQARKGTAQVHAGDGGDVDFAAVIRTLERLGYRGRLSIEYFDLPEYGWGLEDPVGWSVALASQVRPLLARG